MKKTIMAVVLTVLIYICFVPVQAHASHTDFYACGPFYDLPSIADWQAQASFTVSSDTCSLWYYDNAYYMYCCNYDHFLISDWAPSGVLYFNSHVDYVKFDISSGTFSSGGFVGNDFTINQDSDYGFMWGKRIRIVDATRNPHYRGELNNSSYPESVASVHFDSSLPYVSDCPGYKIANVPLFLPGGQSAGSMQELWFGLEIENYDPSYELCCDFWVAFPCTDLVLRLEDLGYNPRNCTVDDISKILRDFYFVNNTGEMWNVNDFTPNYLWPYYQSLVYVSGLTGRLEFNEFTSSYSFKVNLGEVFDESWILSNVLDGWVDVNDNSWLSRYMQWLPLFRQVFNVYAAEFHFSSSSAFGRRNRTYFYNYDDKRFSKPSEVLKKAVYLTAANDAVQDMDSEEAVTSYKKSEKELKNDYDMQDKEEAALREELGVSSKVDGLLGGLASFIAMLPKMTLGVSNALTSFFVVFNHLPIELRGIFYTTIILLCFIAIFKFMKD